MTKVELRNIYLNRQKQISALARKEKSAQIADLFFEKFDLSQINFLHCFLPITRTNEINTNFIFERLWKQFPHIETIVPRVNFQMNEIENLRFTLATKLKQNQWQIQEPTHSETIPTEKIDVCLIPLLCFDRKGFRVGYGKGFYDKFLKNCRADCLKIGLSYFEPVAQITDTQEFDVKLNFCVAPEKVWKVKD